MTERTANSPTVNPITAETIEEMNAARPSTSLAISIKGVSAILSVRFIIFDSSYFSD